MTSYVDGEVRVDVPATSANLGPGFDCLGLALELRDELTASVGGDRLAVEVTGEGAGDLPLDERHLVVRAMAAAFEALGEPMPALRLSCVNRVPHARGLGSSSAAIVGGIVLARALVDAGADRLTDDGVLALATRIEGHPDNVAPALLGGLVVCGKSGATAWAERLAVDPALRTTAFVPPDGLATEVARGLLPATVSHADAAANSARTALLVAALTGGSDRLLLATEDLLHQSYRRPAMPDSLALVDRLRADGHAAVVSGAGPTVVVVSRHASDPADLASYTPAGWARLPLPPAAAGARVVG